MRNQLRATARSKPNRRRKMTETELRIPMDGVATVTPMKKQGRVSRSKAPAARVHNEAELLAEISAKLDRVVAVLAAQGKDLNGQVSILASAGCDSGFIASVTGKNAGAIRNHPAWRSVHGVDASRTREAE